MGEKMTAGPQPYSPALLKQFDRLTLKLSNPRQAARVEARLQMKRFVAEHGQATCEAMFEVLKRRDAKRGSP